MNVRCNQHLVKIISGNNERSFHIIPLILHLLRLIRSWFFLRDEKKIIFSSFLLTFLHSEWNLLPQRNYLVVLCIKKFEKLKMHLLILDKLFNFENNMWKLLENYKLILILIFYVMQITWCKKGFLKLVNLSRALISLVYIIQKSSTTIDWNKNTWFRQIIQIKLNWTC